MIDRINKVFAALARQHYGIYVLLGVIISFLFINCVQSDAQIPILKKLIYPGIFIIIASGFLLQNFYERSECGGKKVPVNPYGIVVKDDYFLVKISSDISDNKKILGYLYVIFRISNISLHGFVLGLALFMWLTKGA